MAKADMFLRLEGKQTGLVKGESSAPEHPDEIEITDWSWSMQGSSALGGSGEGRRTALAEIKFGKGTDKSTTALMSVMRTNEVVKQAILTVRKAGAVPPVDYLTVTITNGRITSHSIGNLAPGSPEMVESFSIAFEEIEVKYAPQMSAGGKEAQRVFSARVHSP